jgi:transcriptional regulator with XRE-family HTH domain
MAKLNRASELLKYEIAATGTNIEELAEYAGISVERLNLILCGEASPTVKERISIADWFSLNPLVLWRTF